MFGNKCVMLSEKNKISESTKFRVKFHVSIPRYGVHGLKKSKFCPFWIEIRPKKIAKTRL